MERGVERGLSGFCLGWRRPFTLVGAILIGAGSLVGCGADPEQNESNPQIEQMSSELIGYTPGYWTSSPNAASPAIIPVCFENPTAADATFRKNVQDAVSQSWQRYARVNFTNWGTCNPANPPEPGLHIFLINPLPSGAPGQCIIPNNEFGRPHLDGVRASSTSGMLLNPSLNLTDTRYAATHEFGHALGFGHEESRNGYTGPQCNNSDSTLVTGAGAEGAYDQTGIMSYCGHTSRLSANDIAAVQRVYGRRISGQIVSPNGYCMAANSWTTGQTGVRPFLWTCDEFANDQEYGWQRTTSAISLSTFLSSDTTHAAAITMTSATNGTFIEMRDLSASSLQWTFTDMELRGYGAKCLTYPGTVGAALTMNDCSSRAESSPTRNANQRWDRVDSTSTTGPQGLIRLTGTNTCVKVPNPNGTLSGQTLITAACGTTTATTAGEQFFFGTNSAQITNISYPRTASTVCWDVNGPNDAQYTSGQFGPTEGGNVGLFGCTTSPSENMNQQWNVTGQMHALGKCMVRQSGGDGDSTRMQTGTCTSTASGDFVTGAAAEQWDIYWH
jgi:hypothetical protein